MSGKYQTNTNFPSISYTQSDQMNLLQVHSCIQIHSQYYIIFLQDDILTTRIMYIKHRHPFGLLGSNYIFHCEIIFHLLADSQFFSNIFIDFK